jgi:alkaline phosphatase D
LPDPRLQHALLVVSLTDHFNPRHVMTAPLACTYRSIALGLALTMLGCSVGQAQTYELTPTGSRTWVGPQCFAAPMQDWAVQDGVVTGAAAAGRVVSLMACELSGRASYEAHATIELDGKVDKPHTVMGGFRLGTHGQMDHWQNVAVRPKGGVRAAVRADGHIVAGPTVSKNKLKLDGPIHLIARYDAAAKTLAVTGTRDTQSVTVSTVVESEQVSGSVALFTEGKPREPWPQYGFTKVKLTGPGLKLHEDRTFGPILWTQYTLSGNVLKLSAQMPPVGKGDAQTVGLDVNFGRGWKRIADAAIDADARTALFKIKDWPSEKDVPYRVVYEWNGKAHEWPGTVRRDPTDKRTFDLAAFSCDNGYAFPAPLIVESVRRRNPDMLFFAGDQIYEGYGGYGIRRSPIDIATLDYLRKWYQFGWTWREVLRDRPSVIIPDDHDVYQGNIWGHGGVRNDRKWDEWGGYRMPVRWVNMVQRTQTAHLPDPIDPKPTPSGIGVYFTAMQYAGGRLAIIEDRKFKSGPSRLRQKHGIDKPREVDPARLDFPEAKLLGERQLAFLKAWGKGTGEGKFNVVLSQTMFAQVFTHGGPKLNRARLDFDTNGWPQSGRNRALELIAQSGALMVCGDQHFGALVRHGIKAHGDGPLQFMVPGTVNGWPRASWPGIEENNPAKADVNPLGKRTDFFGHRIDVMGIGNPLPRSNQTKYATPQAKARAKGSGYGIVRFNPEQKTVTFELLRYPKAKGELADSFKGFPITMRLDDADRR